MEVLAHINIFKSGELNGQHMFHLGTYGISTPEVMNTSSERTKIATTLRPLQDRTELSVRARKQEQERSAATHEGFAHTTCRSEP